MGTDKFTALISDYCKKAGMDDGRKILAGAPLEVDGVLFALKHDKTIHPDRAYIYCDLGMLPEERKEDICRTLLQLNMTLHPVTGHSMMISPATRHILLGTDLRLHGATVAKLDDMLSSLVDVAQNWKKMLLSDLPAAVQAARKSPQAGRERFMRGLDRTSLAK